MSADDRGAWDTHYSPLLVTETSQSGAPSAFGLTYGYNANGHLGTLQYPNTRVVSYAPDALGRATMVADLDPGGAIYASGISYYANGAISGFTYGNGIVHTMTQNARLLPTRSLDQQPGNGFKVIDDTTLFDANGNVTDITDQAQAGLTTRGMGYDGLDRLTAAVSPGQWGNATYAYDPLDNLRTADQGPRQYRYSYNTTSNRLTDIKTPGGATVFTFGYDARGNTTNKSTQAYVFDSANRLSQVTGSQVYRYDGQGRRVQTTDTDGKTTFWIYSQSGQVLYASEARHSQNLAYIYLGNTQVATRAVAWTGGAVTVKYQHTDALGTPVAETMASPNALNTVRHSYSPYGEALGTPVDGTGYTGHVMDQGTGLTYMQQRYYDPQVGRFLSVDPVTADSATGTNFNRYKYASSNPYKFVDPDGRRDIYIGGGGDKNGSQIVQSYAEGQQELHPDRDIQYFSWRESGNIADAMSKPLAHGEPLNVIGHSLGGAQALMHADQTSASITNLITIDPVGAQGGNGAKPASTESWVNVTAAPATSDRSDKVATVGRMIFGTTNTSGATTSQTSTAHHGYFKTMMGEVKAQQTIDNSYKKPEP